MCSIRNPDIPECRGLIKMNELIAKRDKLKAISHLMRDSGRHHMAQIWMDKAWELNRIIARRMA